MNAKRTTKRIEIYRKKNERKVKRYMGGRCGRRFSEYENIVRFVKSQMVASLRLVLRMDARRT